MKTAVWTRWSCAALAATALGCPQPVGPEDTTSSTTEAGSTTTEASTSGVTTGGSGIQTVTSLPNTSEGSSEGSSTGADVCAGAVSGLAALIAAGQPCEVLVHFDEAKAPQGFAVVCGESGTTWSSAKDLGMATQCCIEGPMIYAADQDLGPVYMLHLDNPMGADGVAILSNHTGRVVLDAMTADGAPGPISVPSTWAEAALLAAGQGCGDEISLAEALSVDLASGSPLAAGELDALAAALGETALGPALAQAAVPVRSAVLRYSPQNGGPAHDFVLLEVAGK